MEDPELTCTLPPLPDQRVDHTMSGLTVCGGTGDWQSKTCLTLDHSQWRVSHHLTLGRTKHISWTLGEETFLIGGSKSSKTSEIIRDDGSVEPSFSLNHGL